MSKNEEKKYRYVEVYKSIYEDIRCEKYKKGALLPSEKEIGNLYGVQRTTVRKALGLLVADGMIIKQAGVGAKIINSEKIETTSGESNTKGSILFFFPKEKEGSERLLNPYYSLLFMNIEESLKDLGYQTIYSTIAEDSELEEVLKQYDFKGVIFSSYNIAAKHINYMSTTDIPYLVANGLYKNAINILSDNIDGGYIAIKHLLELGHTKISIIAGLKEKKAHIYRLLGCKMAMESFSLEFEKRFILYSDWKPETSYSEVKQLLSGGSDLPTAFFAFNDGIAMGALRAITELGFRIPEDFSFIGYDNIVQSQQFFTPLTTIDSNLKSICKIATEKIHSLIQDNKKENITIMVPVSLVDRGTTRTKI